MDPGEEIPSVRHIPDFRPGKPGASVQVYETRGSRLTLHHVPEESKLTTRPGEAWVVLEGQLAFPGGDQAAGAWEVVIPGAEAPVTGEGLALAYEARTPEGSATGGTQRADGSPDRVQRNQFIPLVETPQVVAALLGIAAGRRMTAGPESERTFVPLRGTGLLFFDEGTTLPFRAGDVAVIPPGWPVRVWARGPEDVALLVLQPGGEAPRERRTLASEIARKRHETAGDPPE